MSEHDSRNERLSRLTPEQRARFQQRMVAAATKPVVQQTIPRVDESKTAILSFAQERMWFLNQAEPLPQLYNRPTHLRILGRLNVEALRQALAEIVRRHAVLRTSFPIVDGLPTLRIADEAELNVPLIDFSQMSTSERENAAGLYLSEESQRPFDLSVGPVVRGALLRLSDDEHWLALTFHHIAFDAWSEGILWREFEALYEAAVQHQTSTLPELVIQYADYSAWQRSQWDVSEGQVERDFWQKTLSGAPAMLSLPSDFPRPLQRSGRGAIHRFSLDSAVVEPLILLSRSEGATLFHMLLASFQILIMRYSGQSDICLGVPVAGRTRPELESLIGCFVNTMVSRAKHSEEQIFRQILRSVRDETIKALENQDLPFEKLLQDLRIERSLDHSPLFSVMLNLRSTTQSVPRLSGLSVSRIPVDLGTAKFDLTLNLSSNGVNYDVELEYATDLYKAETVARMADHYTQLLRSIADNPDCPMGRLNLMGPEERHRILVEWNQTERDYPRNKCVHQLFEEQVTRTPDAPAILFAGKSLTYSDLNIQANRLARELKALGVGPDVTVGVCLTRTFDMVVALMGILKAGGAYVPLDPNYPLKRLEFIAEDSQMRVVLTHREIISTRQSLVKNTPVIYMEDERTKFVGVILADACSSSQLAYLIYTSGSTGQPKGVAIEHRNTVSFLYWVRDAFSDLELSGVLGATSICFDLSVFELFGPLSWGGKVVLVDQALDLFSCESRDEVTLLNTVPSVASALLKAQALPTSVITVNLAGEPLSPALVDSLYEIAHIRSVNDLYGPSETTTYSTWARRKPQQPATIGRPIANTEVYVLDERLQPVPCGTSGDLWIGDAGVARGYWRRPDLTAERFRTNPFSLEYGGRIYQTGDLARWRLDGQLEYLGRSDHQVKIRGYRIELAEIDSILSTVTGISECAVVTRQKLSHSQAEDEYLMLVAFVVLESGTTPSAAALQSQLSIKLPDYMIPSQFFVVPAMPWTANGKLDRKALMTSPIGDVRGVELIDRIEYVAPGNNLERVIAEIWQSVLGLDRVGITDSFFDIGGHSLKAIVIASRLRSVQHGRTVPLRWIFEFPTIEALARKMESEDTELAETSGVERADRCRPLPMSSGQQAMWLLHQLLPNSATYNLSFAWRVDGAVDRARIQRTLQAIVERHEVLRTALMKQGGALMQQIVSANDLRMALAETSLRDIPVEQQVVALEALTATETLRPLDLAQAPLWRLLLIELTDDEYILFFTFHHSIFDEWSLRLFAHEFEVLYSNEGDLQRANLPELTVQYADYACWQLQKLTGDHRNRHLAYWKEQLADLPPALELPSDRIQRLQPTGQGAVHEFRLDQTIVTELRQLAREERMTLFTVLLASFQVWLYRYTGQTDLIVGTPLADRDRPEVQSLIGYFLNMLPIRSQLESDTSFRQVLRQIHQTIWNAFSHADLPFEQMVELAAKQREPGRNPIYQVMFVLLEESVGDFKLGSSTVVPLDVPTRTSKNDLTLDIQATGEEWVCRFEYATDLFSTEAVARMADHFTELLRSIVKEADIPIGQLKLMGQEERHKVLVEWNQTERDYPRDKCVHQLFEEQAQRTPNAVAVEFEEQPLTYGELNVRANQLARYLQKLGIAPETRVGICVDRSLEMIIGLLAILKAGGAYVPLDPHYPAERLNFMIVDTGITLILTQQHLESRWQDSGVQRLVLDADHSIGSNEPDGNLNLKQSSESLAYVIYTSGSTGTPKGVEVVHRGIVRLLFGVDYVQLDESQSVLQLAILSFDASTFEIWGPLLHGGRCVLAPAQFPEPEELQRILRQNNVRTLWLTTSLFNFMVDGHVDALKGIEQLLVGGEALSVPHIRRAQQVLGSQTQIINGYGPTESTTFACCHRLPALIPEDCPSIPIGRPISNTTAYVLDSNHEPVPVGVTGELYVGGDGLARGYLNQPGLTAEQFLQDPFSDLPNARMYRTGDLVRWRNDGTIEFLGRRDQQIKLRGFRIETGEIETVLLRHSAIRQAVVVLREDRPGDKRLVAYIVPQKNQSENFVNELRQYLHHKLPDYMIPSSLVTLDDLPLTANGKVDKSALPRPDISAHDRKHAFVSPRNSVEEMLAGAWSSVLGINQISVYDNFFELGGHSLLAVRVVDAVKSSSGITIKVADLFRHATVAELAESLPESDQTVQVSQRGQYLESIRPGKSDTHLVIVGAKLRVPLEMLPPEIPVWWLKLDGLHVWPPQHLDLPTQAAIHAQELLNEISSGTLIFCGHSYGGLLAIEIARQLTLVGKHAIKLILLEPTIPPDPDVSIIKRAAQKVRHYKKRIRLRLVQELAVGLHKRTVGKLNRMMIRARQSVDQKISPDDRWRYMEPFLFEHVRAYQLPDSIEHDVHLIKTEFYGPEDLDALNQIIKGAFSVYDASDSLDHLDIADARHSAIWMSIVQQLIAE